MKAKHLKSKLDNLAHNTKLQVSVPKGDGTYIFYNIEDIVDYGNGTATLVCSRTLKNNVTSDIEKVAQFIVNHCLFPN